MAFSLHRLPLKKIPGILLYLQHPRHYTQKKLESHVKLQFLTLLNLKPTFAKYFDCATRKITANVRERNRREAENFCISLFFFLYFIFIFCLIPILYFLWLTWRARFSKRRRNSLRLTFVLSGEARINIRGLGGWLPAEPGQSFTALVYNVDWQQDPKLQTPKVHSFLLFFCWYLLNSWFTVFFAGAKLPSLAAVLTCGAVCWKHEILMFEYDSERQLFRINCLKKLRVFCRWMMWFHLAYGYHSS